VHGKRSKVKFPTLSHRTRPGWGSLRFYAFLLAFFSLVLTAIGQQPQTESASPVPATSPVAPVQPGPLAHLVTKGWLTKKVNPKYPKEARKKRIEGAVVVNATISKDGDVTDVQVVSGHPLLTQAATDAVRRWKYHPYYFLGKTVDVKTTITVIFQLTRN